MRKGDVDAVQHVRARVRRILSHRGLGVPIQERDDLEQEVMAELWRAVNRAGFDFTAGFWGFVEIVTSRRCIDWLRSRRGLVAVTENIRDQRKSPFDSALDSERSEIAAQVLGNLDSECRKMIVMRIHKGMTYQSIAEALGKSEGAVRVQMHRCIRAAQHLFHEKSATPKLDIERGGADGSS